MSMGKRIMPGRPPDKGSFPLDHFSECSDLKEEYLRCLKENKHDNMSCRYLSKKYLQCRMDRNLMRREPMKSLGFTEEAPVISAARGFTESGDEAQASAEKEQDQDQRGGGLGGRRRWHSTRAEQRVAKTHFDQHPRLHG
ncbi:unnamed protein product [Durusdinium trenchii]|uniref:CHCH domain-containing protein n=1 Tax=Durusdinium trenchii TaxID=1381693 RepID=A0ABP0N1K8_9DINO